jgi:FAD dependent oxidoreductase TIGR03364
MKSEYDLAVVGAGIVGLGVALAAASRGKKVVVIERNAKAVGASIRNFGFVTVSGQQAGAHWARAMRSRDIWAGLVEEAGIEVLHQGLVMPARRAEAVAVLEAFLADPMGEGCRLISPAEAAAILPALRLDGVRSILYSPHEIRVESSEALPKLASWLETKHGVDFRWCTAVRAIDGREVETSRGTIRAEAVAVCPGDDFASLYPERIAPHGLRVCTLQMLRVAPAAPSRFGAAVMSDMSFARYEGFSALPEAEALMRRLDAEEADSRAAGIHLIAVQSADGSLVVGDSHVYGDTQAPFAEERLDALIMAEFDCVFDLPGRHVVRRWIGTYASSPDRTVLVDRPAENARIVMVTGGTGASTGFALGEQVVEDLFGTPVAF